MWYELINKYIFREVCEEGPRKIEGALSKKAGSSEQRGECERRNWSYIPSFHNEQVFHEGDQELQERG